MEIEPIDEIASELHPFADPGTDVEWHRVGKGREAAWQARGILYTAKFSHQNAGGVVVDFNGSKYGYRDFLALPEIGDIAQIARMTSTAFARKIFVDTKATAKFGSSERTDLAISIIDGLVKNDESGYTDLLFVIGDAGAGKTELLREATRRQADLYLQGGASSIYLYINAQGRALAHFDEALAIALSDIRASATYHSIPTLVRNGLVVPVIDGFDELLGVAGYDDAFSSLSRFLEQLRGQGHVIASSRSTYFEQEFVSRSTTHAEMNASTWKLLPIKVAAWSAEEFDEYLRQRYSAERSPKVDEQKFRRTVSGAFSDDRNRHLKSKPLFVSKTAELVIDGLQIDERGRLFDQLVAAYLAREQREKLLDRNGKPILDANALIRVLSLVAEEMWFQETRELDQRSVREVVELGISDLGISEQNKARVVQRVGSFAFLATAARGRIQFEHELFYAFFLGRSIADKMSGSAESFAAILSRAPLPPTTGVHIGESRNAAAELPASIAFLSQCALKAPTRTEQVRENLGEIFLAALGGLNREVKGIDIEHFSFAGCDFSSAKFINCKFFDCKFIRANLCDAKFENCHIDNVIFSEIIVSRGTHFGFDQMEPSAVLSIVSADTGRGVVHSPLEIAKVLRECGLAPSKEEVRRIDARILALLEKLWSAFERTSVFWPTDDQYRRLVSDQNWDRLIQVALDHGLIRQEQRDQSGVPKKSLRRLCLPEQVTAGFYPSQEVAPAIASFWAALEKEFPQPAG